MRIKLRIDVYTRVDAREKHSCLAGLSGRFHRSFLKDTSPEYFKYSGLLHLPFLSLG